MNSEQLRRSSLGIVNTPQGGTGCVALVLTAGVHGQADLRAGKTRPGKSLLKEFASNDSLSLERSGSVPGVLFRTLTTR